MAAGEIEGEVVPEAAVGGEDAVEVEGVAHVEGQARPPATHKASESAIRPQHLTGLRERHLKVVSIYL